MPKCLIHFLYISDDSGIPLFLPVNADLSRLWIRLYWPESDIASLWVHRESIAMFTQSSDKNQRKF